MPPCSGSHDRGVLGQLQVDEQFRSIRCREELLWNKAHAVQCRAEQTERHKDRDPTRPHG